MSLISHLPITLNNITGEDIINEFLLHQCELLRIYHQKTPKTLNKNITNCAVIVEPRSDHLLLEAVCRNVMYFLPNDWDLIIFSYDEQKVRERLQNIEFIFYPLEKSSFDGEEYSKLLLSLDFWSKIPSDNILIFQTDSYIVRKFSEDYINYIKKFPFIGGIYRFSNDDDYDKCIICPTNKNFCINGGFSFRNKQAMIDCIKNVTFSDIIAFRINKQLKIIPVHLEGEDVIFEHSLHMLNYELPSEKDCKSFCTQTTYDLTNYHAVHGFNKKYVYSQFLYLLRPNIIDFSQELSILN